MVIQVGRMPYLVLASRVKLLCGCGFFVLFGSDDVFGLGYLARKDVPSVNVADDVVGGTWVEMSDNGCEDSGFLERGSMLFGEKEPR